MRGLLVAVKIVAVLGVVGIIAGFAIGATTDEWVKGLLIAAASALVMIVVALVASVALVIHTLMAPSGT